MISVGILFWNYYEFSMNILLGPDSIQDRTDSLSKGRLEFVRGFSESLKSKYGLDFELIIRKKPFQSAPQTDAKTLFLGVCPEKNRLF